VRIGVHVDDASMTSEAYLGRGVHTAARIGAQAAGSEILVSRAVATAAGDAFDLTETRTIELKGLAEPGEVLSLAWE
jgi:class 3 adenylate cyclase